MTYKRIAAIAAAVSGLAVAGALPAFAHTGVAGHEHGGFSSGFMHPVGGVDHLLAMLAVGIWSALVAKGQTLKLLAVPAAFVAAMLAGAIAGYAGVALPLVDAGIALSVLALGVMIALRIELPALAGPALVAVFALYHGHAHGAEASGAILPYLAGFAITTAGLHIAGIGIGSALLRLRLAAPVVGGMIAATGAYLLAA